MIGRRAFGLLGLGASMAWTGGDPGPAGMRGGIPQPRLDQIYNPPAPPGPVGGSAGILRARQIITGLAGQPQVLIDSTLNYSVSLVNAISSVTPADVTSVANIRAAVRFPSNEASEVSPPLIAETLITFTDGSVADALLTLSGFNGIASGAFSMLVSARSVAQGGNSQAVLTGQYSISGSTITLSPWMCDLSGGGGGITTFAQIVAADPAALTLLNFGDSFHSLGSTGLAGDGGTAEYKLSAENEVILSVHKGFNALGGVTSATFASALPGRYRPPGSRLTGGVPISLVGAAPGAGTRLTITGATGAVNLINLPAGATAAGCDVRIPLT